MKKLLTKVTSIILVTMMLLVNVPTQALAASKVTTVCYTKSVDLSGYKKHSGYKVTTYMDGSLKWIDGNTAKFSGVTGGKYHGTVIPDSITHTDEAKLIGLGSVSVSTSSADVSIDKSIVTYTYNVTGENSITNNVSYLLSRALYTYSVTVTSTTEYKFGNINFRVVCGDS